MKKIAFQLMFAVAICVSLPGCTKEEPTITITDRINVLNLITPLQSGAVSYVQPGTYSIEFDQYNGRLRLSSSDIKWDNKTVAFETPSAPYQVATGQNGNIIYRATPDNGMIKVGASMVDLTDIKLFMSTPAFYYPSNIMFDGELVARGPQKAFVLSYNVGDDFRVNTFPADAYYVGSTTTTYPTQSGFADFQNNEIVYRVVINANTNKGTVVMYNVKLAESMPTLTAFVLKNLDIEYKPGGYTIKGENIEPQLPNGTALVPNPNFTVDEFLLTTTNPALGNINVSYKVKGIFTGNFSGSYFSL